MVLLEATTKLSVAFLHSGLNKPLFLTNLIFVTVYLTQHLLTVKNLHFSSISDCLHNSLLGHVYRAEEEKPNFIITDLILI